jgi:hypothetical protein
MPHAPIGERDWLDRARLRTDFPTWDRLAPHLEVRVSSRAARVAEALRLGKEPSQTLADVVPLGPRLGLDLVVRTGRRWVGVADHLRALGVPPPVALRVALHQPVRWLRPGGGGEPGTVHLAPLAHLPGVAAVDIHDGSQLAGLLLPPERLLPGGQPVVLPLSPARLLVADKRNLDGLRTLLSVAEGARDDPSVMCTLPHARVESAPGAFSWGPWRPAADHPLHGWVHRLGVLQDYIDDRQGVEGWRTTRPDLVPQPLVLATDPRAAGSLVSVARWPRTPCSLPAADCFDIEGPDGTVVRAWVDGLLDVLSAETVPLDGAWPPRFVASGGVSPAGWKRVRSAARF